MADPATSIVEPAAPVSFETHPSRCRHWRLSVAGPVATLTMDVNEEAGIRPGYRLKLNSYDLGVDIELKDALQRIRFEHPEVRSVILSSGKERIFCSGANIFMLASSSHLRRIIVTQGDTEPASVEQQRHLGSTCPSLYDLRNLFQVPHKAFNRKIGPLAGIQVAPDGRIVSAAEWAAKQREWLATDEDRAFVASLMGRVTASGAYANWISPPTRSINKQPKNFEYVRFN